MSNYIAYSKLHAAGIKVTELLKTHYPDVTFRIADTAEADYRLFKKHFNTQFGSESLHRVFGYVMEKDLGSLLTKKETQVDFKLTVLPDPLPGTSLKQIYFKTFETFGVHATILVVPTSVISSKETFMKPGKTLGVTLALEYTKENPHQGDKLTLNGMIDTGLTGDLLSRMIYCGVIIPPKLADTPCEELMRFFIKPSTDTEVIGVQFNDLHNGSQSGILPVYGKTWFVPPGSSIEVRREIWGVVNEAIYEDFRIDRHTDGSLRKSDDEGMFGLDSISEGTCLDHAFRFLAEALVGGCNLHLLKQDGFNLSCWGIGVEIASYAPSFILPENAIYTRMGTDKNSAYSPLPATEEEFWRGDQAVYAVVVEADGYLKITCADGATETMEKIVDTIATQFCLQRDKTLEDETVYFIQMAEGIIESED